MSVGDCQETGTESISMKNDFAAIFGEEVGKEK